MTTLATRFRAILAGIQTVIGTLIPKNLPREPMLARIYHHLSRTIGRWESLVAHWRNNTLPKPRRSRPGRPACPRAAPRLPNGASWLIRTLDDFTARGHASQLEHFLTTAECAAFLAEVPRANRILRPLTRSLGIRMPGAPPPPPPKPARPPKNPWLALPPVPVIVTAERRHPDYLPLNFSKAR
jgi:hypothetical protein